MFRYVTSHRIYYVILYYIFNYIILLHVLLDCYSEKNAAQIFGFANFFIGSKSVFELINKYCFRTV
jgi:hypothetical protein